MWYGWAGKVLRVNLSDGAITEEELNREWALDYVGGRGWSAEGEPAAGKLLELSIV